MTVGFDGRTSTARVYAPDGRLLAEAQVSGSSTVSVPTGGFAVVSTDEAG